MVADRLLLKGRLFRGSVLIWTFLGGLCALAQEVADGDTHESFLGQKFVAVPGTTVLFATTETRVSDFKTFLESSGYEWSFKPHFEQAVNHPVVGINLQDAVAFCNWLTEREREAGKISLAESYRLPTEDEWSAAGGMVKERKPQGANAEEALQDRQRFPWGLEWPPPAGIANLAEGEIEGYRDDYPFTSPVGQFKPSADGLLDLSGNAWEWTWSVDMSSNNSGVLRGGSWAYFRDECLRSAYRYQVPADMRAATFGFRVVYEDRQRTANLMAAAKVVREEQMKTQREQVLGSSSMEVSDAEREAMRQRLAGGGGAASGFPDVSTLTPVAAGQVFSNSMGAQMLPLKGVDRFLAATETTVRQYERFLSETGRMWPSRPSFLSTPNHPVAGVSWEDAKAFCEWLTRLEQEAGLIPVGAVYRLPTDLEWSSAAGLSTEDGDTPEERAGGNKTHFPWGDGSAWPPPRRAANLDAIKIDGFDDSYAYTCEVSLDDPNEHGFYELGGNVSEWCLDAWPSAETDRVVRGGSWLSSEKETLLTSYRVHAPADASRQNIGFRYALELTAP